MFFQLSALLELLLIRTASEGFLIKVSYPLAKAHGKIDRHIIDNISFKVKNEILVIKG